MRPDVERLNRSSASSFIARYFGGVHTHTHPHKKPRPYISELNDNLFTYPDKKNNLRHFPTAIMRQSGFRAKTSVSRAFYRSLVEEYLETCSSSYHYNYGPHRLLLAKDMRIFAAQNSIKLLLRGAYCTYTTK